MLTSLVSVLATITKGIDEPPVSVADAGTTALLITGAVLGLGLVARFFGNRKK